MNPDTVAFVLRRSCITYDTTIFEKLNNSVIVAIAFDYHIKFNKVLPLVCICIQNFYRGE